MSKFIQSIIYLIFIAFLSVTGAAFAQQRPNILWLVTEDMSPYLRSYGNKLVRTPNLRFTCRQRNPLYAGPLKRNPVFSFQVDFISGVYSVSLGTDIHREKRPVPDQFYFPKYLREAGYYTTNNAKQDYNNKKTPEDVWNEFER